MNSICHEFVKKKKFKALEFCNVKLHISNGY